MMRHCCRVCGRSFPSGRSLGGHMRSHVLLGSSLENPRKSWQFDDVLVGKKDKICTKWNSFFGRVVRDELNEEEEDGLCSNWSYEEEIYKQSVSEVTAISASARRQRRRKLRRIATISASSSPPASSPEYENEQEYGAWCLLMLSRGASSVTDSSESGFSSDGDQEFKKRKVSSFSSESFCDFIGEKKNEKDLNSAVLQCDSASGMHNSGKRSSYKCKTCNKSFHSHQALGGHCTSHKKMRRDPSSESPATKVTINQNHRSQAVGGSPPECSKAHGCSICGKVFASGQALGGHKRSHLVAGNNVDAAAAGDIHAYPVVIEKEQKASKLNLLDLNLPATDDEGCDYLNGNIEYWV